MNDELGKWLALRRSRPDLGNELAALLGNLWKISWNRHWKSFSPVHTPEEALTTVLQWADEHAEFPLAWKKWVRQALHSPEQLAGEAEAVVDFCANALFLTAGLAPKEDRSSGQRVADYRGVPCPLNSVRARMELAHMDAGQHLLLLLDCGSPIENVPGALIADGHHIRSRSKEGQHWVLDVERGATRESG